MRTDYFKQIYYDMRYQPVIAIVSIVGTALAIFFIMITVMTHRAEVVPFAPEGNRDRTLYGCFIHLCDSTGDFDGSAGMSLETCMNLYGNLSSAEAVTFFADPSEEEVIVPGMERTKAHTKFIDDAFFKVFDHEFLAGAPLSKEASDAGLREIVVAENIARRFYASAEAAVGKNIYLRGKEFRIVGVVRDSTPITGTAYGDAFVSHRCFQHWNNDCFGNFAAAILAKSPDDFDAIRAEVTARKRAFDEEHKKDDQHIVDHGTPFTQEQYNARAGSNGDPRDGEQRTTRYIIYAILLIIPAINLSCITRSRLRHRTVETGLRRAFGARRLDIVRNFITENFFITLAGAIIGLTLSLCTGYFFADMITETEYAGTVKIPLSVLFDWNIFAVALLFCFILNLLSTGLPAWQASRVDPVAALNNRDL